MELAAKEIDLIRDIRFLVLLSSKTVKAQPLKAGRMF